jgi:hypothetical protein
MQTYVERLTRELQRLEELLATPRSRMSKAAIGTRWVDMTDRLVSGWTQRVAHIRRRLEVEKLTSEDRHPSVDC